MQAIAEAQFGDLLETQGATLVGEDTDGLRYDLKFRFWINNQSRMYLIEGCTDVLKKYKLGFGDVIVFARKADNTLVLGGRPQGPVRGAAVSQLHDVLGPVHSRAFDSIFGCESPVLIAQSAPTMLKTGSNDHQGYGILGTEGAHPVTCSGGQTIHHHIHQHAPLLGRFLTPKIYSFHKAGFENVQEDLAKRPAARARSSGKGDEKARLAKRRKEGPLTGMCSQAQAQLAILVPQPC
jgi:hypothetical protein